VKLSEHSGSGGEQRVSEGEPRMNRDERRVLGGEPVAKLVGSNSTIQNSWVRFASWNDAAEREWRLAVSHDAYVVV
jgi:hypothetical protein